MGHSTARQVSQAAARRDVGLARMTALTVGVGLAAAVGSAGLAVGLVTAGNTSSTQEASAAAEDSSSSGSSSSATSSSQSGTVVQVPQATRGLLRRPPGVPDGHHLDPRLHPGTVDGEPDLAAAAWRALGCDVRLLVTDPAALAVAREMLAADLDALDRAASRFRLIRRCRPWHPQAGGASRSAPVLADAVGVALAAAEVTSGSLDPTMGAELVAAGYDRDFAEVAGAWVHDGPGRRAGAVPGPACADRGRTSTWMPAPVRCECPRGRSSTWGYRQGTLCGPGCAADRAACGVRRAGEPGRGHRGGGRAARGRLGVEVQDVTGDPVQDSDGASATCLVAISSGGLATSQHDGAALAARRVSPAPHPRPPHRPARQPRSGARSPWRPPAAWRRTSPAPRRSSGAPARSRG